MSSIEQKKSNRKRDVVAQWFSIFPLAWSDEGGFKTKVYTRMLPNFSNSNMAQIWN